MWLTQSLSVFGSGMTGLAMNVYLAQTLYPAPEQKAELALAFTILNLGLWIPYVFGGPFAGAWVDRHDRRQILIGTNIAKGLIAIATFTLMLSVACSFGCWYAPAYLGQRRAPCITPLSRLPMRCWCRTGNSPGRTA
jgi:MFS family permease